MFLNQMGIWHWTSFPFPTHGAAPTRGFSELVPVDTLNCCLKIAHPMWEVRLNERLELIQGDITKVKVDAVVNAANSRLLGGGGVDGAIHRAAGPQLLAECRTLGGCPTGEARITKAYNLRARWVIHTVGPIWHGGDQNEDRLLAACYQASLALAEEHGAKTIAFPAISTGVYRFPPDRAAAIAVQETIDFLGKHPVPGKVIFVCFDERAFDGYQRKLTMGASQ